MTIKQYKGEIAGSVLIGMARSFKNVHLISDEKTSHLLEQVEPEGWYPVELYFRILDDILGLQSDMEQLLFQAGVEFINDWYTEGGGRKVMSSSLDFIRLQSDNRGYASVVKGTVDEVGWLELVELDEERGKAVILCVNPFPTEFERGVLYGGMYLSGDMEYVDVSSSEEEYGHLKKKTMTIRFRKKPGVGVDLEIGRLVDAMTPDRETVVPKELVEEVAWKYKTLKDRHVITEGFWKQSNNLLIKAANTIQGLSRKLYQRTVELEKAMAEIKTLRGIIPICSYCKKIRNEQGSWGQLELYIRDRSEAEFSHGICPDCAKKVYPDRKLNSEKQ